MTALVYGELHADNEHVVLYVLNGNDWETSTAADRIRMLTPQFKPTEPKGGLQAPVSWALVTQLANAFPQGGGYKADAVTLSTLDLRWTPGPRLQQWIMAELLRRTSTEDLVAPPPARSPMPHQTAGALAIAMTGRFLLADSPGAGKTTSALMGLAELAARGRNPFPAMVMCPAAVVDPWLEEAGINYPSWRTIAWRGPRRKEYAGAADLYVMSYETMRNDTGDSKKPGPLQKMNLRTVLVDEAHKITAHNTKQSIAARRLMKKADYAIAMTGTPIKNHVGEFWSILTGLHPEAFPSRERYTGRYCTGRQADYGDRQEITGLVPERESEFRTVLQGTMRHISKKDVLKDLPDKMYSTRWVELPDEYRKAYTEMEEDMLAHLPDNDEPLPVMTALAQMTRLAQLASAAADVRIWTEFDEDPGSPTFGEEKEHVEVTLKHPCWKADALLEVMDELRQDGERHPVVAFAPLTQLVKLAGESAEKAGYQVGYIIGGQSAKERTRTRQAFQDCKLDLLCVNTAAGGTGITLTAGSTCVFLSRPWSFVDATQSEDRLHRTGQTKQVQVIDIVARNTIEARVRSRLKGKAGQLSELVKDPRIVKEFLGG